MRHEKLKILAHVNHYFGPSPGRVVYQSNRQDRDVRRGYVEQTIASLKDLAGLPEVQSVEIKVCGVKGKSLVPVDLDFSGLADPRQLIFESLAEMATHVGQYDYFINIEDDIAVPRTTFENVLEFDREALVNEVLHPNRVEIQDGTKLPIDPVARPRVWTYQEKRFADRTLRVATNPHSGLLILSRPKLEYCLRNIDVSFRGHVLGAGMESAFAHFHKPFSLYRPYDDLDFHVVIHQDCHHPLQSLLSRLRSHLRAVGERRRARTAGGRGP